ncbi:uncharacterized protein PHACADRAFT_206369 [Phanerochaete carnosa HHB-10118-sp]|uniref:Uncharacterized protein n=1 Tax=Phanerochaete carnosa (strain HHB-10118-sp) TaxID=650164 RepID=K5X3S3_PHACS|nr:uncharacterized protein PHACADRAFT_206369 [Phanerochaete carnosa HHB-10118-sp]EKM57462.1 hypothetical protein PHACADRAFT_206369 [Phanerochaete carnosa HHB-10118-sp]
MGIFSVLEQGDTTAADCKLLLANYFPSEFTHADQELVEMFIATATRWLSRSNMQVASQEVVVDVLEKMIGAADVMSVESAAPVDAAAGISQGDNGVEVRADHREWIQQLCWKRTTLAERCGALFRRLLHALEEVYKLDKLYGHQDKIRDYLRSALETAHNKYGSKCEVDGRPWISHVKNCQDDSATSMSSANCSRRPSGPPPS